MQLLGEINFDAEKLLQKTINAFIRDFEEKQQRQIHSLLPTILGEFFNSQSNNFRQLSERQLFDGLFNQLMKSFF